MVERASIFQTVQIGVETTPGVGVAANRLLSALSIDPAPKVEMKKFRPKGQKFQTMVVLGKEWTEAKLSGVLTYTEVVYPLASVLAAATPTRITTPDGLAYLWQFAPSQTGPDTVKTFTVEQGGSVRAHKFCYGLVNSLKMKFSRGSCELEGAMLGKALEDGITMTGSPTAVELAPVLPMQVSLYLADSHAGLEAAPAITRGFDVIWGIEDRYRAVWELNAATQSFAAVVEAEPKFAVNLKAQANATWMPLLNSMRAGASKFLRIQAVGDNIETGNDYSLQIDTALKVADVSEFSDEDGVFALEWTLDGVYDATWGKATQVNVVNKLSSL